MSNHQLLQAIARYHINCKEVNESNPVKIINNVTPPELKYELYASNYNHFTPNGVIRHS